MIEKLQLMTLMFLTDLKTGRVRREDERGATAVEYGMLVALIAAVIVATVVILGKQIEAAFTTITEALPDLPTS
ncbi:Flp family type IVb pilin [Nocardioides soli]|uniref:Pilus assembly protein Flp/PilA n=1 Tax=Nocardioides soli TaxID=1036020 RepID=A0A7W4VRN6_9ACTN|nr:Flp family type IVb pilin [Nocardioides soli]MBB3040228.1 pilus assembly protein Flp/PilA [Nocardioides soli]